MENNSASCPNFLVVPLAAISSKIFFKKKTDFAYLKGRVIA